MASRRHRPGSRWTPTKPAPETSVALPPSATGPEAGTGEGLAPDAPSLQVVPDEPSPVEAALAKAEVVPPEVAHPDIAQAEAAPVDGPPQEPAAPPASGTEEGPQPPGVGFPRRGQDVRAAASTPLGEINATLASFVRSEGQAALAHLEALSKAGSPAEAVRLQFGEFQRAADASLTCFGALLRTANRFGSSTPRS